MSTFIALRFVYQPYILLPAVCAKTRFPQIPVIFFERPAGFHCHKCPSPTFANIWSHCPWALQSAAPVYLLLGYFTFSFSAGVVI